MRWGCGCSAGFSNITFSYPGPACAVIVGCPKSPSPHDPPDKGEERERKKERENVFISAGIKEKTKERYILEGRAWSILFARTWPGLFFLLPLDLQRNKYSSSSSKSGLPAMRIRPGIFPTFVFLKKSRTEPDKCRLAKCNKELKTLNLNIALIPIYHMPRDLVNLSCFPLGRPLVSKSAGLPSVLT